MFRAERKLSSPPELAGSGKDTVGTRDVEANEARGLSLLTTPLLGTRPLCIASCSLQPGFYPFAPSASKPRLPRLCIENFTHTRTRHSHLRRASTRDQLVRTSFSNPLNPHPPRNTASVHGVRRQSATTHNQRINIVTDNLPTQCAHIHIYVYVYS